MTASKHSDNRQKSIHVLHIASGDLWAGAEVMLYTLAKTLHNNTATQVSAVILNHGELEQKLSTAGITVYILDESKLSSFQIFQQINKIVGKINPDLVHTHRNKENFLGSIAARYKYHKPSLRTAHGAPEHRPPLHKISKHLIRFMDWFSGRFLQSYIVAVSPDLAIKLEHSFPPSIISTIENGIDIQSVTHGLNLTEKKIEANGRYRIGIAGRLTPVKRVDIFINCAVQLKQQHKNLHIDFFIYGDGPLQEKLQQQVKSLHAEDYIHFEGHCENISHELQKLDALLMTSDHEGLPMILLEAMCTHTPIIAHAVGGIPNLLDQGKCGTLVTDHTAEAFAQAISKLIQHPEQHQQLAQQAALRIEQKYSAEINANDYLNLYKKLTRHD